MMVTQFLKKYKKETNIITLAIIVYFVTRLVNLLSLPIFTDEAIYIRWAQIANNDPVWRLISLTDGKQPMFVWVAMVAMRFIDDPLLASRLVSVGAGFFSLIGMFFLGREIFKNHWIGVLSLVFYVLYPFALVYDRMALYDSMVGTFAIWSLYLAMLLVRTIRLDAALLSGFVIGGGVLTKSNAFFNLALLPLTLILFDFKKKDRNLRFFKWIGLAALAGSLSFGFYSILRLSPYFNVIDEKNHLFVYSLDQWLIAPFRYFEGNWKGLWDWFTTYLTYPLFFVLLSSFFVEKKYFREKLFIILWCIAPFIYLAFFGKTLYPRFIFFMTLPLLPLIAFTFYHLKKVLRKKMFYAIVLLCAAWPLYTDFMVIFNFPKAPIPRSDLGQYSNDWPSGGGIKETVEFFREESKKGKIIIATQGTFGLMPFAYEIYFHNNPNVEVIGIWPIDESPPKDLLDKSKKHPTYIIFYQPCNACENPGLGPKTWKADLVFRFQKPRPHRYLSVYRLTP